MSEEMKNKEELDAEIGTPLEELFKEALRGKEELSERYLQLSMTAAEESNKYTSATLKRLLQCLTIYPFKHKEYANLGPQAMATFDKMATAKDMYVDLGMFIIQVNKLDSALKAERSEDNKESE